MIIRSIFVLWKYIVALFLQTEKRKSKDDILSNINNDYALGRGRHAGDKVGNKKNGLFFNWKRFSTSNSNNNNKLKSEESKIEKESQVRGHIEDRATLHYGNQEYLIERQTWKWIWKIWFFFTTKRHVQANFQSSIRQLWYWKHSKFDVNGFL